VVLSVSVVVRAASSCVGLGCFLTVHLGGNGRRHLTTHDDSGPRVRLERSIRSFFLQKEQQWKLKKLVIYKSRDYNYFKIDKV
jgi:hypothetical protein